MKYMNQATEDRRPARIALSVALAGALVTMSLVSLLPASQSRADTLCIAPTQTASPTETPPGPGLQAADAESERSVTLAVDRGMVTTGGFVTMTGTLTAADGTCVPGTKVKIEAETVGSGIPSKGGKGETNDEGVFVATVKVGASAEYTAVAPGETKEDEDVLSAPVTVLSRVVMTAKARDLTPDRHR